MLILLPPSETKRDGGSDGSTLDLASLSFPELDALRREVEGALNTLAADPSGMAAALKLSAKQQPEVERNRTIRTSATMPAMDRYTGVLYDALDSGELPDAARSFAEQHLAVHSALFGLVGAADQIPAYRLSHDSRVPGLSLKKMWREPIAESLATQHGLIIDMRSEAYAGLGPAPQREGSYFLRVVAEGSDGQKRALNHFNKKGKGEFVRALLVAGNDHADAASLIEWANASAWRVQHGVAGELELEVVNSLV